MNICLVPHRFWLNAKRQHRLFDGDTFKHRGLTFKIECPPDEDMGAPWKECDGHGPVRYGHVTSKRSCERVLSVDWRGEHGYIYDWAGAIKQAKEEGWGWWRHDPDYIKFVFKHWRHPTAGEIAAVAVERDFNYLRGWLNDRWCWVDLYVTCVDTGDDERLGGMQSNDDEGISTEAYELADQIADRVLAEREAELENEAREMEAARPDMYAHT